MKDSQSQFEKLKSKISNNPFLASLMIMGMIVIALSTFTDAAKNLLSLSGTATRPVINGEWVAEIDYPGREATYSEVFRFEGDSNDLYGAASYLEKNQVILEGTISGDQIDFETRTIEFPPDWNSNQRKMATHHYRGRFSGNEISFVMETYGGFSSNPPVTFIARRQPDQ